MITEVFSLVKCRAKMLFQILRKDNIVNQKIFVFAPDGTTLQCYEHGQVVGGEMCSFGNGLLVTECESGVRSTGGGVYAGMVPTHFGFLSGL